MSEARRQYRMDGLPVPAVDPGSNVLVAGPSMGGARTLAFRMVLAGGRDEGRLLVSTNRDGEEVLQSCEAAGVGDRNRVGVVDCLGGGRTGDGPLRGVSNPEDLTGIGIEFSALYEAFHDRGVDRVRTGLDSVSTLLMYHDLRTVSRFVNTLGGRIASTDGVGVFFLDSEAQDEQTVSTITQFCDARIDVRETGAESEFRTRGFGDRTREWTPFDLDDPS